MSFCPICAKLCRLNLTPKSPSKPRFSSNVSLSWISRTFSCKINYNKCRKWSSKFSSKTRIKTKKFCSLTNQTHRCSHKCFNSHNSSNNNSRRLKGCPVSNAMGKKSIQWAISVSTVEALGSLLIASTKSSNTRSKSTSTSLSRRLSLRWVSPSVAFNSHKILLINLGLNLMRRQDSVNMLSRRAESWIQDPSVFRNHNRKSSHLMLALWVRALHQAVSSVKDSKFQSHSTLRTQVPWRSLKEVQCTEFKEIKSRSSVFQLTYKFNQALSLRQS